MNTRHMTLGLLLCLAISATAFAQETRLLRHPTVSRDLVAFAYAGDLWLVVAERWTGPPPHFDVRSRDGSLLLARWFSDRFQRHSCR